MRVLNSRSSRHLAFRMSYLGKFRSKLLLFRGTFLVRSTTHALKGY